MSVDQTNSHAVTPNSEPRPTEDIKADLVANTEAMDNEKYGLDEDGQPLPEGEEGAE